MSRKLQATNNLSTILAGFALAALGIGGALGQTGQLENFDTRGSSAGSSPGQLDSPDPVGGRALGAGVEPSITSTSLTARSHSIGAGGSAGNLEGNSCTAPSKMVSGACHPGYNDRVTIINQFPNIPANTWRCGFRNNTGSQATVWIYTLCAQ